MVFFALLFSSTAFVSLPLSILTFSVFGRLAATCSALILPLVLFCVWCCCCFCLSRVLVFDFLCPLVGRSAGQPGIPPVNRATAPVSRSTGQPGRGGVNRDPVSRLPGPVGRLPPYSENYSDTPKTYGPISRNKYHIDTLCDSKASYLAWPTKLTNKNTPRNLPQLGPAVHTMRGQIDGAQHCGQPHGPQTRRHE